MSKFLKFVHQSASFLSVLETATRSNRAHNPKSWWAVPSPKTWLTLWRVCDSDNQIEAVIGSFNYWYEEGEYRAEWKTCDVEEVELTVFMATNEWRNQGKIPGVAQWNPHRSWGELYYLCFQLKGVTLPLPWLWGSIIPHPETLLLEKWEAEEQSRQMRERSHEDALWLIASGREAGRPSRGGRSSRQI